MKRLAAVEYERRLINPIDTQPLTGRRAKVARWATDADTGKQLKPGVGGGAVIKLKSLPKPVKPEKFDQRPTRPGNDLIANYRFRNESETLYDTGALGDRATKQRETDMDVAAQLTTWAN